MSEALGVIAGLAILAILWKPFFGDLSGFLECLKFWFTPNIISVFRGEWHEDRWGSMKLLFWLLSGIVVGFAVWSTFD